MPRTVLRPRYTASNSASLFVELGVNSDSSIGGLPGTRITTPTLHLPPGFLRIEPSHEIITVPGG